MRARVFTGLLRRRHRAGRQITACGSTPRTIPARHTCQTTAPASAYREWVADFLIRRSLADQERKCTTRKLRHAPPARFLSFATFASNYKALGALAHLANIRDVASRHGDHAATRLPLADSSRTRAIIVRSRMSTPKSMRSRRRVVAVDRSAAAKEYDGWQEPSLEISRP